MSPLLKLAHQFDPERIHHVALAGMSLLGKTSVSRAVLNAFYKIGPDRVVVRGVTFPNRVGIAAGFDKNAQAWECLLALGFGHVEIGTLTPLPQAGHLKPRIFRLADKSLANRMGFPNQGVWAAISRLKPHRPYGGVVGANIGPNSGVPLSDVPFGYVWGMEALAPYVDYFTINISSPNSIRHFQSNCHLLKDIAFEIHTTRKALETRYCKSLPLFVKVSPDLAEEALEKICQLTLDYEFDGIVATNTNRLGVSGRHLKYSSLWTLLQIRDILAAEPMVLVGVGGIETREDAEKRFDAGADLLQVYTSFIYQGPGILRTLCPFPK